MIFADNKEAKGFSEVSTIRYPLANPIRDFRAWNQYGNAALTRANGSGLFSATEIAQVYRNNNWVMSCVNGLTDPMISVPLKVFTEGDGEGSKERVRDSRYAKLLARPSRTCNTVEFYQWVFSTYNLFGKVALFKVRDEFGIPVELQRVHPARLVIEVKKGETKATWSITKNDGTRQEVNREDLVIVNRYNPDTTLDGFSWLEPLTETIDNDKKARLANSAMWAQGGKPAFVLTHPNKMSRDDPNAIQALADQFQVKHGGVANWGKPLVLEEGMQALPLKVEHDMEYGGVRTFNRNEIVSASGLPPSVVGVLDKATYSNVSDMSKQLYIRTMPPHFKRFESTFEHDLRIGYGNTVPDFDEGQRAEFVLDGVLRGDFETKAKVSTMLVTAGIWTPNEGRHIYNMPPMEGGDELHVNLSTGFLDQLGKPEQTPEQKTPAELIDPNMRLDADQISKIMGSLGRIKLLAEVDINRLTEGLEAGQKELVTRVYAEAFNRNLDIKEFRDAIRRTGN